MSVLHVLHLCGYVDRCVSFVRLPTTVATAAANDCICIVSVTAYSCWWASMNKQSCAAYTIQTFSIPFINGQMSIESTSTCVYSCCTVHSEANATQIKMSFGYSIKYKDAMMATKQHASYALKPWLTACVSIYFIIQRIYLQFGTANLCINITNIESMCVLFGHERRCIRNQLIPNMWIVMQK